MEDTVPSKQVHREVPPTKANCEEDFQDKVKLNVEFEKFKKLVREGAKSSPDVEKLVVPLTKLEKVMNVAAHGVHFVVNEKKKEQS
jgi:hypothetical protein